MRVEAAVLHSAYGGCARCTRFDVRHFKLGRWCRRKARCHTGRIRGRRLVYTVNDDDRTRDLLSFELQPQLFIEGVSDGDPIGRGPSEQTPRRPFDVEIPEAFQSGRVNHRIRYVVSRHSPQLSRKCLHRHVMAGNHKGRRRTGLGLLRLGLASGTARPFRFLQFWLAFSGAQHERRYRLTIGMDDKLEPVRQQSLEHQLHGLG